MKNYEKRWGKNNKNKEKIPKMLYNIQYTIYNIQIRIRNPLKDRQIAIFNQNLLSTD